MDLPTFSSTLFNPFSPPFEPNYQTLPSTSFTDDPLLIIPPPPQPPLDDLLLQIPAAAFTENDDLFLRNDDYTTAPPKNPPPLLQHLDRETNNNDDTNPESNDRKKQKIAHREIERQRRGEMSLLHASLRSLLPHDYLKGKRAMSDHLGEAVKYINHLQQNVKALNAQRDALKKELMCVNDKGLKPDNREVKVKLWNGGVDIRVSTSCKTEGDDCEEEGLPLSKVFRCLMEEGLDVVSSISHRVENSKLLHCIQAHQVEGGGNSAIDVIKLQKKLEDL